MGWALPRLLSIVGAALGVIASAYFVWSSFRAYQQLTFAEEEAYYESVREPSAVSKAVALVSLDEVFANVNSGEGENRQMHTLGVKLDIELFDEDSRALLDQRSAGVKDSIISTAIEQDFDWLNTIAGKLFFKEKLVARINEHFNKAIVRDIHFSSFYLQ